MVLASTCVVAAAARGDPLVVGPLVPAPPVKDAAWWRFVCRLVQRNATHTALYVEKHAGRNYAHALYNTILYNRMCLESGGIKAAEATLTLPSSLQSKRAMIQDQLPNVTVAFSRDKRQTFQGTDRSMIRAGPVGKIFHETFARRAMGDYLRDRPLDPPHKCPYFYHVVIVKRGPGTRRSLQNWDAVADAVRAAGVKTHIIEPDASWSWGRQRQAMRCADVLVCLHGAGCTNGVWLRRPSLLIEVKSRYYSPWGTIFGYMGAAYAAVHADRLERTDPRGFMHLRTKYWKDGVFRLSDAGIQSVVDAVEAHRTSEEPPKSYTWWVVAAAAVVVVAFVLALRHRRRRRRLSQSEY